jgi:hypothetical protein
MSKESNGKHGITFGWHVPTQRMVTVREVANGRDCNCVCIACGTRLQARQGEIRNWHFAHDSEIQCQGAAEAAIHHMAKQLISERGAIYLPHREKSKEIHGKRKVWSEIIRADVQHPGLHSLDDCQVEKTIVNPAAPGSTFRPDLLAMVKGLPLAIEILNTHAVEPDKATWLKEQGYSALEIDVHDIGFLPQDQMMNALEVRLFETADYSSWLCHAADQVGIRALAEIEAEVRARRQAEETILLAQLEMAEAAKKRKEEFLRRVRDIAALKIRVGDCTVRIGRNYERVSLKIHGYASDDIFAATKSLAREHRGHFNRKAKCWEFFRDAEIESFYDQLCEKAQQRLIEAFCIPGPAKLQGVAKAIIAPSPECPLPVFFHNQELQETFDERAAILEYDAGHERRLAEQIAFVEVLASTQSPQPL